MRVFFYGTLLDTDIRRAVLQDLCDSLTMTPAELPSFRRVTARDSNYPVLVPCPSGRVKGYLADGLDLQGLARAAYFEGAKYHPVQRAVRDSSGQWKTAWLFLPVTPRHHANRTRWSLLRWQRQHKRRVLSMTKRWMAEFGARSLVGSDLSWQGRRTLRRLEQDRALAAHSHNGGFSRNTTRGRAAA